MTNQLTMQLDFVPVEEFYFALTLAVKTLEDIDRPGLAETVGKHLKEKFGQSSTVAAAKQNNFNYVFRVQGIDNTPANQLVISVSDWQGKLRFSSDYGWTLDENRHPVRTEKFPQREDFCQKLKFYFQDLLQVPIIQK